MGAGVRPFQNKKLNNRAVALTFVIGKRCLSLQFIFFDGGLTG